MRICRCSECGGRLEPSRDYCTNCGCILDWGDYRTDTDGKKSKKKSKEDNKENPFLDTRYTCSECGHILNTGRQYCPSCGTEISWDGIDMEEPEEEPEEIEEEVEDEEENMDEDTDEEVVYSCGNCGGDITEDMKVCPNCKCKLVWE